MKRLKTHNKKSAWSELLKKMYAEMKAKDPSIRMKDVMKAAKKVYKK
jgi:hypothetical protein